MIDTSDLDKADVLAALYNHAKPTTKGIMHYDPTPMTKQEAQEILDKKNYVGFGIGYIDCIKGRAIKMSFSDRWLDTDLYDKFNGAGTTQTAIATLDNTREGY